jgi:DNA processing protein
MLDAQLRLEYAAAVTRFGGGQANAVRLIRRQGLEAFESIHASLTEVQLDEVLRSVEDLQAAGVDALLLGEAGYPLMLANAGVAAPALFMKGQQDLLEHRGFGVCGSRNATDESLRAARACSESIAIHDFTVVSGYARGVDMTCHVGALAAGGTTVIVLPEGILNFRIKRGDLESLWDPARTVVVSQFAPRKPWSAGGAMGRNAVIAGLSHGLVVVEAGETGGTLAAGMHALDRGQPVLTLELSGAPAGNRMLQARGAIPIRSRQELEAYLLHLPSNGSPQLTLL